jgi:hypothetical protein
MNVGGSLPALCLSAMVGMLWLGAVGCEAGSFEGELDGLTSTDRPASTSGRPVM